MRKILFIDVSGTLIHHETGRAVPVMPELVSSAMEQGWDTVAVSRHSEKDIMSMLTSVNLEERTAIRSSAGSTKGEVVRQEVADRRAQIAVFVDDKPDNLGGALEVAGDAVRVLGFLGSRKYTPELSTWCRNNRVELALSAVDLAEALSVPLSFEDGAETLLSTYTPEELCAVLPGTNHPMSTQDGPKQMTDHQVPAEAILSALRSDPGSFPFDRLWEDLVWVACTQCMWKLLVQSVAGYLELDMETDLGNPYKDHEHVERLAGLIRRRPHLPIIQRMESAIDLMERGLHKVGRDAEKCRPAGRTVEPDRIGRMRTYLDRVERKT